MELIKRTGWEDYPDKLKMLVTGPPKSGKTSFLGSIPNIIIADTEPHANNLQSVAHLNVPYVTVSGLDDLKNLLMVLGDPGMRQEAAQRLQMREIEAVGIDTLDTLQAIAKGERLREQRQTQFLRDDWAWLREEMVGIIRAFTALPMHVVFTAHTKASTLGFGDEERNIVLPGLQGSIAEDLAGMVGYSLYCFRRQEIAPDGSPYIKYWMRTEGDEVFTYLGNRAAGQLPSIIDPNFSTILATAMKGRARAQEHEAGPPVEVRTSADVAPAAPAPATAPAARPDSDDPITPNAMTYVKKIYDGMGLSFPQTKVQAITLGQARKLVQMWQAVLEDEARGVEVDGRGTMRVLIEEMNLLDDGLDMNATIEGVLAQVGRDARLIAEAIAGEQAKPKPRSSLLNKLEALMREVGTNGSGPHVEAPQHVAAEVPGEPEREVQTEDVAPSQPETLVQEEVATNETAMAALAALNAEVITTSHCERCGNEIDDQSIASLARARYQKSLCTNCYIETTRGVVAAN